MKFVYRQAHNSISSDNKVSNNACKYLIGFGKFPFSLNVTQNYIVHSRKLLRKFLASYRPVKIMRFEVIQRDNIHKKVSANPRVSQLTPHILKLSSRLGVSRSHLSWLNTSSELGGNVGDSRECIFEGIFKKQEMQFAFWIEGRSLVQAGNHLKGNVLEVCWINIYSTITDLFITYTILYPFLYCIVYS